MLFYIASIDPVEVPSDVVTIDPISGPTLVDDLVEVELEAVFKNTTATRTDLSAIVTNRYLITFSKISGPTLTPEVPRPVEGAVNVTVETGSTARVPIVAIPATLKNEEPLTSLRMQNFGGKFYELRCLATVELWGADLSGNTVKAVGYFTARFADWGG
jgi:hypothetical protein